MNKNQKIIQLSNQEIDYEKWDNCIQNASNGNVYAKSWYLDIVSPGWQAFILDDYTFVMPIPIIKKYGIKIVSQPLHCQQLGIFPAPDSTIQQKFNKPLLKSAKLIRYQINSKMDVESITGFEKQKKTNYNLPLEALFETIQKNYSTNTKRNIKKAKKANVFVVKGLLPHEFFNFKKQVVSREVPKKSFQILNYLTTQTITNGKGIIYAAYSKNNVLCAAAFILFDQNKAYYLNAFSSDEGKENRAMYLIVDEFIKEYNNTKLVLDFEGSMIEGVARFYKGFGAIKEDYYYINSNRIPIIGKIIG